MEMPDHRERRRLRRAALCSLNVQKEIDDIKASMAYLELSGSLEFQERFVNSLNF